MTDTLSPHQGDCVKTIVDAFKSGSSNFNARKMWGEEAPPTQLVRIDGFAGTGKAQPLNAVIQTPSGPILMGDIQLHQEIFGADGQPTKVIAIHPQGILPTFRVTFRDRTVTHCGAEHLWAVASGKDRRSDKFSTLTTKQLIEKGVLRPSGDMRFRVPVCAPVEYDSEPAPFDPYLIGALLGDGYVKANVIALIVADGESEIAERVRSALPDGLSLGTGFAGSGCRRFVIRDEAREWDGHRLRNHLEHQEIHVGSRDKFIPRRYLLAPISDRTALLHGLMDTDGSVRANRSSFSTSSKQLAEDLSTLVRSLGGITIIRQTTRKRTNTVEYAVNVKMPFNPFWLPRKASRWAASTKNPPSKYIADVTYVGDEVQQCITVEAPDGLYLTDDFIVTHNSTILPFILEDLGYDPATVAFVAPTGKAAKVMRTKLRAQRYPNAAAATIHSSIYRAKPAPVSKLESDLAAHEEQLAKLTNEIREYHFSTHGNEERLRLDQHPKVLQQRSLISRLQRELENAYDEDKIGFQLNPDAGIADKQLIVVDEFSMVGGRMAQDLMSFNVPILAMGDPGQLPPVEDEDFLAQGKPDFFLHEIHRQAADNPIIQLSKLAREGEDLPYRDYGQGVIVMDRQKFAYEGGFEQRPQFIVGKNDTRWRITQMLRQDFGFTPNSRERVGPRNGEPVIVKKNHREFPNLVNGTDCLAMANFDLVQGKATGLFSFSDDEEARYLNRNVFQGKFEEHYSRKPGMYTAPKPVTYRAIKSSIVMDWNYVATAHSAQGSQWDDVVVIDESSVFRRDANRWLYTAVTRAAKTLVVLR